MRSSKPPALQGTRVLVVDAERAISDFIAFVLDGCRIHTAKSFDAARRLFATNVYDVAILDVDGVSGFDLLAEFSGKTPCIMLTARPTPQDLARSIEGGAALFLPKQEMANLDHYLSVVFSAKEPLWPWLFRSLDFCRWFGPS